jgi:hypothetical protein
VRCHGHQATVSGADTASAEAAKLSVRDFASVVRPVAVLGHGYSREPRVPRSIVDRGDGTTVGHQQIFSPGHDPVVSWCLLEDGLILN